ncbi:MAG: hypothetical protein AAGU78_10165 [Chloroflexota bacterium]|jgi:hypothetical protein
MLSAGQRTAVIIGMWFSVAVGMFAIGVYGSESGRDVSMLFVVTLLFTVIATGIFAGALPGFFFKSREEEKTKRERDSSLDLLLGLMTDDERLAFKEALKRRILENATDGELGAGVAMLATLDEAEAHRHRR